MQWRSKGVEDRKEKCAVCIKPSNYLVHIDWQVICTCLLFLSLARVVGCNKSLHNLAYNSKKAER